MPELIYCASGNARFAQIAIDAGFRYGAQVPNTVYFPPYFCDQNWRKPNRERYMVALAQHRPFLASVLDFERQEQLPEVLGWAEEAAQYAEVIMLIPKVQSGIEQLPRVIGGKPVRLGYSVPTSFGGTELGLWEFGGWPVHLLGGSPQTQMRVSRYLDVVSADGNTHLKAAQQFATYWSDKWVAGKIPRERDGMYKAFELSCKNIMAAWQRMTA